MSAMRKCLSLFLCLCVSTYTIPVFATAGSSAGNIFKAELSDDELQKATGAGGSVDAVMVDYTLGGTTAKAVIANRTGLTANYTMNLTDSNGNLVEVLTSGQIFQNTAMMISGAPPFGGTTNRYIQVRVQVPVVPALEAVDVSWAAVSIDSDGDGLTDVQERENGLDPFDPTDALADNDGDGLTNIDEINIYNTQINNPDTDGDSISDGDEVTYGLNPKNANDADLDPDRDFMTNADEINLYGGDPNVADPGLAPDADGDGVNDRLELALGMDPQSGDVSTVGLDTQDDQRVMHVLNRLTFGPTNALVDEVRTKGLDIWIDEQLTPIGAAPPIGTPQLDPAQDLLDNYFTSFNAVQRVGAIRPVHSVKQLQIRMARFWSNHFNTAIIKTSTEAELAEDDLFFVEALGNFRTLLGLSAKGEAMMRYLDLNGSTRVEPNENYAREVMELHTLGVTSASGLYGPADIAANARILSGWALKNSGIASRYGVNRGGGVIVYRNLLDFNFNAGNHDDQPKVFMGEAYPQAGETGLDEGERMLTFLATHAVTAENICGKLARHFISDTPAAATLAGCKAAFMAKAGAPDQIAQVLDNLFDSVEFNAPGTFRAKFKDNQEYMISLARLVGRSAVGNAVPGSILNVAVLGERIEATAQGLYSKGEPTGWPEIADEWINANAALSRFREGNTMTFDTNQTMNLVDYFTGLNLTSSGDIMAHLFMLMLGSQYDLKDMEMGYWALHPAHKTFALTDADAESRLRGLVARLAQLPEFSLH